MNMPESILNTFLSGTSLVLALWGILVAFKKKAWLASVVLFALSIAGVLILFFHPLLHMHSGAILLATSTTIMVAFAPAFTKGRMAAAKIVFPFLLILTSGQVLDVLGIQFNPWITLTPAIILYVWIQFERRILDEDLLMESSLLLLVTAFVLY
jgi:hypothetical protein